MDVSAVFRVEKSLPGDDLPLSSIRLSRVSDTHHAQPPPFWVHACWVKLGIDKCGGGYNGAAKEELVLSPKLVAVT